MSDSGAVWPHLEAHTDCRMQFAADLDSAPSRYRGGASAHNEIAPNIIKYVYHLDVVALRSEVWNGETR